MEQAGYSKRPLRDKLGIKAGQRISIINPPEGFGELLGELPEGVELRVELEGTLDFIHFFTTQRDELAEKFPALKAALAQNGMLWISWPKGASKIPTDLNENTIRNLGLNAGLVDVKVAAIDQNWSGLKFVYRLKDRT